MESLSPWNNLVEKHYVSLDLDLEHIPVRTAAEVTQLVVNLGSNRHATCPAQSVSGHALGTEGEENSIDSHYSSEDCSRLHGIPPVDSL